MQQRQHSSIDMRYYLKLKMKHINLLITGIVSKIIG
jgi:hypothetical protein